MNELPNLLYEHTHLTTIPYIDEVRAKLRANSHPHRATILFTLILTAKHILPLLYNILLHRWKQVTVTSSRRLKADGLPILTKGSFLLHWE